MHDIISVKNLKKHFGEVKAVDGIDFTVQKGDFFGFLGVNGAGKSTTINILSALMPQTDGTAEICGFTVGKDNEDIHRKIGVVYQHNCLDGFLTAEENLILRGVLYENRQDVKKNLRKITEMFELGDILKKRYKNLSGGQKRRCEIAAALMHTPEILFLDEPTTGLDPSTRKIVWKTIEKLRANTAMTVFLTTHYMEEAAKANKIVIIDKGKIYAQGTPFELKEKFAKDKLMLYTDEDIGSHLSGRNFKRTDSGYTVYIDKTLDAVAILNELHPKISGFETIAGSMDDVFLNAVGSPSGLKGGES